MKTLEECHGKYIALCEGDDYWTDPYKLQKQVDYLEENPECSFCFTDFQVEINKSLRAIRPNFKKKVNFTAIDLADQSGSIAQTCTLLVRKECIQNLPSWVTTSYTADWCMQLYFTHFGKGGYIPENTAVYRVHEKGVWSKLTPFDGWRKNLTFYKTAIEQIPDKNSKERLLRRITITIKDALELSNVQANKTEIRNWLWQKLISCPLRAIPQTLHSFRLLFLTSN
tara:strand:- start:9895 stop:10572 length:678 start_codon:yes stop_codon:yes gene_type:complete